MKKIKTLTILAAAPIFALLSVTGTIAIPEQDRDVKSIQKQNGLEVAGSIVITDKPQKVLNYAGNNNLEPNFLESRPGAEKIIALEELPTSFKVRKLKKDLNVDVKPNYVYRSLFTPNDPKYSVQWSLPKIKAPKAWDITRGSSSVTVAVIDTGVLFEQTINGTTYSQPDFPLTKQWNNSGETGNTQAGDACWTGSPESKKTNNCDDDSNGKNDDWRGWDFMGGFRGNDAGCPNNGDPSTYESSSDSTFVEQDNDPQPYSCDSPSSPAILNKNHYDGRCVAWESSCDVGHGTMVSSVIAAATDNNNLIAGIDHNAKIMSLRALDGYGYSTSARIASAINYAADNGADVINMSLGMACNNESFTDSVMESAIANAKSNGVVSVAASGNDGNDTICYPATSPDVIAVGATDQNDKRLSYSSYSKNGKLDVVAPSGVPVANAPSAYINSNYYSSAGGTSLSTPHVAGLAALLKGNDPSLTRTQITNLITNRADKVAGMNGKMFHTQYGYGRINLHVPLAVTEGQLPIYRLYRSKTGSHFYTASTQERDGAVNNFSYRYEKIEFWARDTTTNTIPIYRLYRSKTGSHFYTASTQERDGAKNFGYRYEKVGFYLLDEGAPATVSIYRLYRSKTGSHFYTRSSSERDNAATKHSFRNEGERFRAE